MIVMTKKLRGLMDELKVKNAETYFHCLNVKDLTARMLKLMNADNYTSYTSGQIDSICKGALLHDLGKLYVNNYILTKESSLTPDEKRGIKEHTKLGVEAIEGELTDEEAKIVEDICLYHHERIDGNGYEHKNMLPLYVQIVSVCDAFSALRNDRVYHKGFLYDETIRMIENGDCGYFDPQLIGYLKKATFGRDE